MFSLSAVMYLFSFWYGFVMIKEEPRKRVPKEAAEKEELSGDRPSLPRRLIAFLKDFFDMKHIQETFRVAFKEGENMRRKRVILLMIVVMVVIGPMHGEWRAACGGLEGAIVFGVALQSHCRFWQCISAGGKRSPRHGH